MANRFAQWLARHVEYSVTDTAPDLEAERLEAARLPTFTNVWGCMDCSVVQIQPVNSRCQLCQSAEMVNLAMQLQRGATRVQGRRRRSSG